jgi:hypothetical protein
MSPIDPDALPRRTYVDAAAYVIAQFEAMGLSAPRRLVNLHRILQCSFIPFDDPDFRPALEALHDLHQLRFIFEELRDHRDTTAFKNVAKHMVNDSSLPQDDENSPGRDYQFHLYLAAICHKAGLVPLRYDEPDIVCTVEGAKFGIAAKRIKSQNVLSIGKHLKKAAKQLAGQSLPGIIAVDLTLSRNPTNAPMMSRVQGQLFPLISDARGRQFCEQHKEKIRRWIAGVYVQAILLVEFNYRIKENDRWGRDCMFFWIPASTSRDPDPLFASFYERFSDGWPT